MGINIPYTAGELVYVVQERAITHTEKEDLGYDHLGHRGYREHIVTDGYEWVVKEKRFYYGLLDEVPLDHIFRNQCSAQFKQLRLQMRDRRVKSE